MTQNSYNYTVHMFVVGITKLCCVSSAHYDLHVVDNANVAFNIFKCQCPL